MRQYFGTFEFALAFGDDLRIFSLLWLILAATSACVAPVNNRTEGSSGSSANAQIVVIDDVLLIDGSGNPPRPHQTIVVKDRRIHEIYDAGSRPFPPAAAVLRAPGGSLIPGLIDSHVHATLPFTTTERQDKILGFMFRGGVTTARDMAGDAVVLAERAGAASAGSVAFPRLYFTSLMAGPTWISVDNRVRPIAHGLEPGQAPWLRAITSDADIPSIIREAKSTGSTGIKLYADLPASLVTPLVREAHRQGLKAWSHGAIIPARPSEAVDAGVDVLSHVMSIVLEGVETMPVREGASARFHDYVANPVSATAITRLLERMRARGTILEPTLYVTRLRSERAMRDSTQQRFRPLAEWGYAFTRRAHSMGIPILAGTDLMGDTLVDSLPFLHTEMELLVKHAGLTPLEAITAATLRGAQVVGAADSLGSVSIGKLADLVVLGGDPSVDIGGTRAIRYVIKGGVVYPRPRMAARRALQ